MGAFPSALQGAAGGLTFLSRTLGLVSGVAVLAAVFAARRPMFASTARSATRSSSYRIVALAAVLAATRLRAARGPLGRDRMAVRYRWAILAVTVVAFMQTHCIAWVRRADSDLRRRPRLSYAAAGTIQTAYFWTYALAQVPVGLLTDRWGARRVMLVCPRCSRSAAWPSHRAPRPLPCCSRGCCRARRRGRVGAGHAAHHAVVSRRRARPRGRLMSAGGGIGGTLGLIVVPLLADALGWRVAYGLMRRPRCSPCC